MAASSTSNTLGNQLTSTTSMSEAGPSMLRQLDGQEQLPQIIIGQSDSRPLNSRQIIVEELQIHDNNTRSLLRSSLERHLSQEELQKKIEKYGTLISEYECNKASRCKGKQNAHDSSIKAHRKKTNSYSQRILEEMLIIMEQFNAKGFVYGMVPETNKPITGASDSLRTWWKGEAMFDKAGPLNIEQYYKANALYSNVADIENKSTAELLKKLSDPTLGSILSLLMQHCNPPQRKFSFENGLPPPWWPTGQESWWGQTGIASNEGPPPYRKPHVLRKKWKIALIITIIKLMSPNFSGLHYHVEQSRQLGNRMNAKERRFWTLALVAEARLYSQYHSDKPAEEAIVFLNVHGGSSSHIAPVVSGYEPSLAPPSNNPFTWSTTVPQNSQPLREIVQEISAVPIPQLDMSGSFAPQHLPWGFSCRPIISANLPMYSQQSHTIGSSASSSSGFGYYALYPPIDQQPGYMPSTGETQAVQDQTHENSENMEFGFQCFLRN